MTKEKETEFRCPRCGFRGLRDELEEEDGLCSGCGKDLSYMLLTTKRKGLHNRIKTQLRKGLSVTEISRIIPCSRNTVYKVREDYYGY